MTATATMNDHMAAVHPDGLLRRRLGRVQPDQLDYTTVMSLDFSNPFRPDAAASSAMPLHMPANDAPTMAPQNMLNAASSTAMDSSFANPYTFSANFLNSFGSLSYPATSMMPFDSVSSIPMPQNYACTSMNPDPMIKLEDEQQIQPSQLLYDTTAYHTPPDSSPMDSSDECKPSVFSTDIDTLMRTIQGKQQSPSRTSQSRSPVNTTACGKPRKRYQCSIPECGKAFYQKTHLEIHTRAHTGVKPFLCKEISCGQRFSQLGNLKTHERRHTGERPYHCDICGKTFAQHGNVRAHKIVHTATKPFTCRLDDCNKQFTQLGNLKSHQNKFHVETIRRLKSRFDNLQSGDSVDQWEKEMWEYFVNLYKNCNRGIKGRGKDRRISNTTGFARTPAPGMMSRRDSLVSSSSSQSSSVGNPGGANWSMG